jgi:hypothetical protein
VQAARNLHDEIRDPLCGQTQDIFDHPTPFHPGKHVFYDHACTVRAHEPSGIPEAVRQPHLPFGHRDMHDGRDVVKICGA